MFVRAAEMVRRQSITIASASGPALLIFDDTFLPSLAVPLRRVLRCLLMLVQQEVNARSGSTGSQKEQAVQRMFTSIARFYDVNNSLLSLGLHHRWKRQAIGFVPLSGQRVLDIGAGTGDLALLAAQRIGASASIIAADLNHPMLAIGLKKIRRKQLERQIACTQVNAERIAARDGAFDAVTTGFCLRNVADLQMALREIHRVLKPGGRLVCLEFSRPTTSWLRRLYDWYSFTLLPWIGTKVSGDTTGVYQYLPASIRSFPDQEALAKEMCAAGFKHAEYHNRSGGIVAIHLAVK